MEWISRLSRVLRSQYNHWQQANISPEQWLEKALEELERQIIELRRALAGAIAATKSSERNLTIYESQAAIWFDRAQLALNENQEDLAREALTHREAYLSQAKSLNQQISEQGIVIYQLKQDLRVLERKLQEAKGKKSLYVARLRSALASQRLQEIIGDGANGAYSNIFEKIETQILELESQSQLSGDPLEKNFAVLEQQARVESELNALKTRPFKKLEPGQDSLIRNEIEQEIQQLRSLLASSPPESLPPKPPQSTSATPATEAELKQLKSQLDQI
jgi:phage shock protein A